MGSVGGVPKALVMGLALFLALGITLQPVLTLAYGPWLLWFVAAVWIGWWVPSRVGPSERPLGDAVRRFALGSVAVTLMSLPVVYVIATLQRSVFGPEGLTWAFQWADPQVLMVTVVALAPMVYVPLLAVRCILIYSREQGRAA
jgi:hypothetical protein